MVVLRAFDFLREDIEGQVPWQAKPMISIRVLEHGFLFPFPLHNQETPSVH